MASTRNAEYYQTYLEKLTSGDEDDDVTREIMQTIKDNLEVEGGDSDSKETNNDDDETNGTIIMDADGNYYFQTSDKMVKVEPLNKVAQAPVKKVAATVVTPSLKRKRTAQPMSVSIKKTKVENTSDKEVKKTNTETERNADEEITSAICNQEEVYEFDENEQEVDDPRDEADADYETKGIVKTIKKTTTETASFTCMICPYKTNKKFLLSRHLKTHSDDRPYKCSVCERGFKTNASLMNHRNTHLGHKPHVCKDCDKAFTTSGELVRHVRYRHTHIKPHKCTECDYSSVEMSKLRRHMRCHTGERPYQCPHCTYASPDTFKLKRHMRIHTGEKPYECDICHARFTQSNSLKHHRLIHSVNEKPVFQCHLCPTTCGRKTDLRLHIKKLHSSDQPIPCKRCGKELPDRYSYKMHVKTHEGEKCYRCEFCPYASISQRHLESHVFIHLDAKPFVCEICQTSFRQKQLLTRHMKVYHSDNYEPPQPRKKDHKCPHCNKMFAFNGNLIRHMETHDPTSRLGEEKYKLKLGRMKRVQSDGTVITLPDAKQIKTYSDGDEYIYEETEEQQVEDEEVNEEEYEEDYNNEDNIQYIYDELEVEEFEEQENEVEEDQEKGKENQKEKETPSMDVKVENLEKIEIVQPVLKQSITVKSENNDTEIMSLEVHDDQGFMVIEVLPDDDDMEEQEQDQEHEQEQVEEHQDIQIQPPLQVKPKIINKKAGKTTVIKTNKKREYITDYFGFEVDEDEEDEETKGAIKLLEMIEQE